MKTLLAAGALAAPALAAACSSCARAGNRHEQLLVALMALFPTGVGAVVGAVVRRASPDRNPSSPEARP